MPGYRKSGDVPPIETSDSLNYAHLNLGVLRELLLTSSGKPDVQQAVIAELSKQRPLVRSNELIKALTDMIHYPDLYNDDLTASIVEALATDPYPEATEAMFEALPSIAAAAHDRKTRHTHDLREYFYQALVTRQRETDQTVWRHMVPRLSPEALVNILTDPAAGPLNQFLRPLEIIDRMPRDTRRQALSTLFSAAPFQFGLRALGLMLRGPAKTRAARR